MFYDSSRVYEKVIEAQEKISEAIRATAEGKESSIVKVVNVNKAEIDKSIPSNDEAIKILLMSLANQLSDIKEDITEKKRNEQLYTNLLNDGLCNAEYTERVRKKQLGDIKGAAQALRSISDVIKDTEKATRAIKDTDNE